MGSTRVAADATARSTKRAAVETDAAGRLRFAVTRLNRLLRQQGGTGLTPTKLAHLATIGREGPLTLGELAAQEQVSPPTVTKVVKELEDLGLLARLADPTDKRVVRVTITDEGRARLDESRTRKTAWLVQRLATLSPADIDALVAAVPVLEELTRPVESTR
jgi:DNA-binding MarR family transcriptional regulator